MKYLSFRGVLLVKKFLIGLAVVLLLVTFRYSIYLLLFHDGIKGTKALSPFVSGGLLFNGFHYLVLEQPILYLGNKPKWRTCSNVNDSIKSAINIFSNGEELISGPREVIYEYSSDIIKLYIKQNDKVILLNAFDDYGGVIGITPRSICDEQIRSN